MFLIFALNIKADNKHETRAVWLTTIGGLDWPHTYAHSKATMEKQKAELRSIFDELQGANINTVLFQTRIRGTLVYPSKFEPFDGCLSGNPGVSPDYDALQFAISEAHKRGMELQAWVVCIPVGRWNGAGCKNLRKKKPNLLMRQANEVFLNPEKQETADYIASLCKEIVMNYDVDGIHLDYIRYPETFSLKVPLQQARDNITRIVRRVSQEVRGVKPWVKISSSPIGKRRDLGRYSSRGWNAEDKGCQDVALWLKESLMDEIYPMMYFRDNQFFPFLDDWKQNSYGKNVVAGLGTYFLSPKEGKWNLCDMKRQMYAARALETGYAMFRSRFFTDNEKGIYDFAKNAFNSSPSLLPERLYSGKQKPIRPASFVVKRSKDAITLGWGGAEARNDSPNLRYNVYCSETFPVDISKGENLLMARCSGGGVSVRNVFMQPMFFAVTATDRYSLESEPAQEPRNMQECDSQFAGLLANDGNWMFLPERHAMLDARYIAIESLCGTVLRVLPYLKKVDISAVKNGMYIVRSLNNKGKTHRIGYLKIKRNYVKDSLVHMR